MKELTQQVFSSVAAATPLARRRRGDGRERRDGVHGDVSQRRGRGRHRDPQREGDAVHVSRPGHASRFQDDRSESLGTLFGTLGTHEFVSGERLGAILAATA